MSESGQVQPRRRVGGTYGVRLNARRSKKEIELLRDEAEIADLRKLINRERLALEYARIAFADIRDAIRWGNTFRRVTGKGKDRQIKATKGVIIKASERLDRRTAAAIAEVWQDKDGNIRLKMHSKLAAIEGLCRLFGWNAPTELTGAGGGPIELADVTDLEVTRRIAFALQSALQQTIDEDGAPV